MTPLQITFVAIGTAILLTGVLSLSWRLSAETGPPPTTPLAANPFATSPAYELFTDDGYRDEEQASTITSNPDRRRNREISELEVEGLKDLLGEIEDDESVIDEEEDTDDPEQRV